jgi:hypothetical protein
MNHIYKYTKKNISEVISCGITYLIVHETKWSVVCQKGERGTIVFSKVYQDNFDWSIFETLNPSDLEIAEKYEAATAICGQHFNSKIPEAWRQLSLEICEPSTRKSNYKLSYEKSIGLYCPLFVLDQKIVILSKWLIENGQNIGLNQSICIFTIQDEEYVFDSLDTGEIHIFAPEGSFLYPSDLIGEILLT